MTTQWTSELGETSKHVRILEQFDDSNADHGRLLVTGMKIWIGRWDGRPVWAGFRMFYNNGTVALHGRESGSEIYEFHLKEGEFICAMDARSGWLLDQATFTTSEGLVLGPYGGPGGTRRDVNPSKRGALVAVKGSVVQTHDISHAVCGLRFCWRLV